MWSEAPLERVLELIIDHRGRTPRKLGAEFLQSGVQVISAQNITGNRLDLAVTSRFVSAEIADRWMPVPLLPGDVLLSSEAPLGCVAAIPQRVDRLCLGQRLFGLRANTTVLDPVFLRVVLGSPLVQARLRERATGTTAQGIKQAELRQVRIPVPPLPLQQAIAGVADALTAKIESNGELANHCEMVVARIFRQTFRDVVKEQGEATPFSDAVEVLGGGTPRTSESSYWAGPVPWISIKDFDQGPFILRTERHISEHGLAAARLALQPAGTVVISARGTVGKVAIMSEPMTFNQSCFGLRPRSRLSSIALYCVAQSAVRRLRARAHGSVFSTITRATFESLSLALPSEEVARDFDAVASPLMAASLAALRESRTLVAIRDALVPKLISGQIRVPVSNDSEEQLGAAIEALA